MTIIIHKTRIITTNRVVYSAWEPTSFSAPDHYTITIFPEPNHRQSRELAKWFGRIGTDRNFPGSPLPNPTWEAYEAKLAARYQRAYDAILTAYPSLATDHFAGRVTRSKGEYIVDPYYFDTDGEIMDIYLPAATPNALPSDNNGQQTVVGPT